MDGRTDRFAISISRVSMLTRDKNGSRVTWSGSTSFCYFEWFKQGAQYCSMFTLMVLQYKPIENSPVRTILLVLKFFYTSPIL